MLRGIFSGEIFWRKFVCIYDFLRPFRICNKISVLMKILWAAFLSFYSSLWDWKTILKIFLSKSKNKLRKIMYSSSWVQKTTFQDPREAKTKFIEAQSELRQNHKSGEPTLGFNMFHFSVSKIPKRCFLNSARRVHYFPKFVFRFWEKKSPNIFSASKGWIKTQKSCL